MQKIYKEGDLGNSIYFIIEGEYLITKKIEIIDKKKEEQVKKYFFLYNKLCFSKNEKTLEEN